jgi:transposase-like protein
MRAAPSRSVPSPEPTSQPNPIMSLKTCDIRKDGETQCRAFLDEYTMREYQAKMETGIAFPPIRVWFDGENYWLADGFQRLAATERAGKTQIIAEVLRGSLSDAKWDSYSANAAHGLPRTRTDARTAVLRALAHPNSAGLSNSQLARHLGIPEATLRRWRKTLSSSNDEDSVRIVNRKGAVYAMRVEAIGCGRHGPQRSKAKSLRDLRAGLTTMKDSASCDVRNLLNIITNWVFGPTSAANCLTALEAIRQRWTQKRDG